MTLFLNSAAASVESGFFPSQPANRAAVDSPRGVPFTGPEEAWFWFMAARVAQNDGAHALGGLATVPRPCEPVDLLKILDRLYRGRLLLWDHILVMHHYGRRFLAPDPRRRREAHAAKLWDEAMARLRPPMERRRLIMPSALGRMAVGGKA